MKYAIAGWLAVLPSYLMLLVISMRLKEITELLEVMSNAVH